MKRHRLRYGLLLHIARHKTHLGLLQGLWARRGEAQCDVWLARIEVLPQVLVEVPLAVEGAAAGGTVQVHVVVHIVQVHAEGHHATEGYLAHVAADTGFVLAEVHHQPR